MGAKMVMDRPNGLIELASEDLEMIGEVGATRQLECMELQQHEDEPGQLEPDRPQEEQNNQQDSEYIGWLTPELTILIIDFLKQDGEQPTLAPELQAECDRPQTLPWRDSHQKRRRSGCVSHRNCQHHPGKPERSANHPTNRSTNDARCRCTS